MRTENREREQGHIASHHATARCWFVRRAEQRAQRVDVDVVDLEPREALDRVGDVARARRAPPRDQRAHERLHGARVDGRVRQRAQRVPGKKSIKNTRIAPIVSKTDPRTRHLGPPVRGNAA